MHSKSKQFAGMTIKLNASVASVSFKPAMDKHHVNFGLAWRMNGFKPIVETSMKKGQTNEQNHP